MPKEKRQYKYMIDQIGAHADDDKCLNWPYGKRKSGRHNQARYGSVSSPFSSISIAAHRAAYQYRFGPIFDGMIVRHSCDNTLCFNPKHLMVGTQHDNIRDAIERGRFKPKGEDHNMSKLTNENVNYIRSSFPSLNGTAMARYVELGFKFGVSLYTVKDIIKRITWKHV